MTNLPPLILTLLLDESSFSFFNTLRKKHFPPDLNFIDAHLTLFHHLPNIAEVRSQLQVITANLPAMTLQVTGLMKLGRGVAYRLDCPELVGLQAQLKRQWREWLTLQDGQGFRPHITVQNKVSPATANALYDALTASFTPFAVRGTGLSLWEYLGGPWRKVGEYTFAE
jgi:2'-5' RNA ligase